MSGELLLRHLAVELLLLRHLAVELLLWRGLAEVLLPCELLLALEERDAC